MESDFGKFGWLISTAVARNVRSRRLQKVLVEITVLPKVLVEPAELKIFILKFAANQRLSF